MKISEPKKGVSTKKAAKNSSKSPENIYYKATSGKVESNAAKHAKKKPNISSAGVRSKLEYATEDVIEKDRDL